MANDDQAHLMFPISKVAPLHTKLLIIAAVLAETDPTLLQKSINKIINLFKREAK